MKDLKNRLNIPPGGGATKLKWLFNLLRRAVLGTGHAIQDSLNSFFERRLPMTAAGLAFYFLLGLIPFLFIVAATTGYLLKNNPGIYGQITTNILAMLPPGTGERILTQIQSAAANWQGLGVVGLVSLVFVAMGLFDGLDEGINAAMGTRKKVGFLTGRILAFAYIIGAIVFFSVAAVAGYSLNLLETVPFFQNHPGLLAPGRYVSIWVFAAFLVALYMILPVRTPKLWHTLVVAVSVAFVWSRLQDLGSVITAGIMRRQAIYGTLAGGAVFLTWMYLLAMLILLGARILDFWGRSGKPAPTDDDTRPT